MDYPVRVSDPIPFTRLNRLGAGASGEVWYAEHEGRRLAVKVAAPGRSLASEIGSLARLRHPNVPALVAADRGATWMVREFVAGARLTSWAHGRPMAERLEVMRRIAETVVAIHGAGVLHGDLSPANILVDEEGQPHVIDVSSDTRGGALGWMAPERLRGEGPTVPADVYGLGALLYAVCTGRPPCERSGTQALGFAVAASLPAPPSSLAADVPADVEELALRSLAWRASVRPPSASAFLEVLRRASSDPPARVVVGMDDERERLRRAIVDVVRGESVLVIVHGPPGSGRSTLLREVASRASGEGLLVQHANLGDAAVALARASEIDVLIVDADHATADEIREALDVRIDAGLIAVRARAPVPALARRGAVHVRAVPFTRANVAYLSQALGLCNDRVQRAWERSQGHPAVTVSLLHGEVPDVPLTELQARMLHRLEEGPARLAELAGLVDLTEHHALDALEPLMEVGLVWSNPEGTELYASRTV
jgi:hypothetical protein